MPMPADHRPDHIGWLRQEATRARTLAEALERAATLLEGDSPAGDPPVKRKVGKQGPRPTSSTRSRTEVRQRVLEYARAHPGLKGSAIAKALKLKDGLVYYHLNAGKSA
jgi:hypothetical protein